MLGSSFKKFLQSTFSNSMAGVSAPKMLFGLNAVQSDVYHHLPSVLQLAQRTINSKLQSIQPPMRLMQFHERTSEYQCNKDSESECMLKFWELYDKDKNGSVTVEEFSEALWDLGSKASKSAIERLFFVLDKNDDETLDTKEIVSFLESLTIKVGILRLEHYYDENEGDAAHESAHMLELVEERVPGLTFKACQRGEWNSDIEEGIKKAVANLEKQNCMMITGDCGFMVNYQRQISSMSKVPVAMSTLCFLEDIYRHTSHLGKVGLITANSNSLCLQTVCKDLYGEDKKEVVDHYEVIGLQDVKHFGHDIRVGSSLDTHKAEREILKYIDELDREHKFGAFLLECTELPQFADSMRFRFGVPVYDCNTMVRRFCNTRIPSPSFGVFKELHDFVGNFRKARKEGVFSKLMAMKSAKCISDNGSI